MSGFKTESEGYAASLRQQASWIDGSVFAADIDADELRAAADFIESFAMPGWQPIETAPKDGTEFLSVGTDSKSVIATKWLSPGPYVRTPHTSYHKDEGFYWSSWSEPVGPITPTHWMPLPAAPEVRS